MNTITNCDLCDEDIFNRTRVITSDFFFFPHYFNEGPTCLACHFTTATLNEFRAWWLGTVGQQIHQRRGQWAFNLLDMWRSDLAEQIRGTNLDPFYNDNLLLEFWEFVERNW